MVTLKIELDVAAQRVLNQFQTYNQEMEKAVENGVKKALEELSADKNFEDLIKERTKEAFYKIIDRTMIGYEMESKIQSALHSAVGIKLANYANHLANQLIIQVKDDKS